MLLDIVILPPLSVAKRVAGKVIRASHGFEMAFVVDNKRLLHHVSLFHLVIQTGKLPTVLRIVKGLAFTMPKITLKPGKIGRYKNTLGYEFVYPIALTYFKNQVVDSLLPLRQGNTPWQPYTPLRRRYFKRCGVYHNIGRFFRPHFTLGKYKSVHDAKIVAQRIELVKVSFISSILAVAEVNSHGQVTRIIKRFRI